MRPTSCSLDRTTLVSLLVSLAGLTHEDAMHATSHSHEQPCGPDPARLRRLRHEVWGKGGFVLCSRDKRDGHGHGADGSLLPPDPAELVRQAEAKAAEAERRARDAADMHAFLVSTMRPAVPA